ncbi:uncharacterized protein METZ01_LOCUS175059, partial [marine metagenome]
MATGEGIEAIYCSTLPCLSSTASELSAESPT